MNAESKVKAGTPHVYQAIAAVQGELAKTGISKSRKNQQPGANYMFRGIDDVYAALSPLLAQHQLVIVPRVIERTMETRQAKSGGALYDVTVHAEFDFVSAVDGSTHTAATFGEAMDSSDKATNKAMSAAYKYAALMTFAIPTEGDNDADASHHEVAGFIDDGQWATITQMIEATGADAQAFCAYLKVPSLKEIPAGKYDAAVAALQAKAAKQKEPA